MLTGCLFFDSRVRYVLTFYIVLVSGCISLPSIVQAGAPVMPERGICAHRGAAWTHPENTLAAFREAIRLGAHMIEFDVHFSNDSALVVIHDATVDRTTDGIGKVADLTAAQLKALDAGSWKNTAFAGEKIPTLREVLVIMPLNVWLNIHLKGGAELGRKVARVVTEQNRQNQAFLACGYQAAQAARQVDSEIMICNMERQDDTETYVANTIAMNAGFIQLKGPVSVSQPSLILRLQQAGIHINYYGTNDADELHNLFAQGIEFPLVDNLQAMLQAALSDNINPLKPVYGSGKNNSQ
jgi:glycerophosphoryl diester phosphodiesterase